MNRLRANSADEFNLGILDKYDDDNTSQQEADNQIVERRVSQHYQVNPGPMIRRKLQNDMIMPSFQNNFNNFRKESMDNNEHTNEQFPNVVQQDQLQPNLVPSNLNQQYQVLLYPNQQNGVALYPM